MIRTLVAAGCAWFSTACVAGEDCQVDELYGPAEEYESSGLFRSMALGDFNGDGAIDVGLAMTDPVVIVGLFGVLFGNGDGTFLPAQTQMLPDHPTDLARGDFNGDGHEDVVIAFRNSDDTSVLLNQGNGTFTIQPPCETGNTPVRVAVSDLDGDSVLDFAVVNANSNDVSVLIGNGDGTFMGQVRYGVGESPSALVIDDVNSDSVPDMIVTNMQSHDLSLLLGNGDGTFQNDVRIGRFGFPRDILTSDFNSDGLPDLAVTSLEFSGQIGGIFFLLPEGVNVLLGSGNGTFSQSQNYSIGGEPARVAAGDLDSDGSLDLVVTDRDMETNGSDAVRVLLGNGDGTFQKQHPIDVGNPQIQPALIDLQGDRALDLVVGMFPDDVHTLLNQCISLCPADCDTSGSVNFTDLVAMLSDFGTAGSNPGCDADGSGTVNFGDLVAALAIFGPCP